MIEMLSISASVVVAIAGWVFVYLHGKATAARAAQLERVNRQLRELYGPLYARLAASDRIWVAFWSKHRPAHGKDYYFGSDVTLSEDELTTWRVWMTKVFEPLNASTEQIIMDNVDLLESDELPDAFVDALAHISAYKAVLDAWSREDYSNHVSVNAWPHKELMELVEPELKRLRLKQKKLLAT